MQGGQRTSRSSLPRTPSWKEAAELGFTATMGQLEKLAEAAYAKGWNVTVQQIHKAASDCFVAGFKDTVAIMESAAR